MKLICRMSISPVSPDKGIKDFLFSGSQSHPLTSYQNLARRKAHLITTRWKELKATARAHFGNSSQRSFSPWPSFLSISGPWIEFSEGSIDHLILIIFYRDISFIFLSLIFKNPLTSPILSCSFCWCPPCFTISFLTFFVTHHSSGLIWTVKSMYLPTALLNSVYLPTDVHNLIQYHCKTPKHYASGQ